MLKTMLRRIAGAFVAAASLAFLPQAAEAKGAPALWSVSDADTTVYLFGTIHLLPDKYSWRTARFDQAVAGSNELVLETIIDDKDPMKLIGILTRLGFSNRPPADRDARPARQGPGARSGHRQERNSALGVRPDGDMDGGVHAARQSVQGPWPQGRPGRRDGASVEFHQRRQADRRA